MAVGWDGVAMGWDGVRMDWGGEVAGLGGMGQDGDGLAWDRMGWGGFSLRTHLGSGAAGVRAWVLLTHYIDFLKSAVSRVVLACPAARTLPLRVFIAGPAPLFSEFRLSFQWPLGFKNLNWELAG